MLVTTVVRPKLSHLVTLARIGPEMLADVRALHRLAVKTTRWRYYSHKEIEARLLQIENPDYTQLLLTRQGVAAWIGDVLTATLFWRPVVGETLAAELHDLHVHPAFTGGGIATRLVDDVERAATASGCLRARVRADFNNRPFFAKRGYQLESFERNPIDAETSFPLFVLSRGL